MWGILFEHAVLEMKKHCVDFVLRGVNKKLFVFKDQNGCFSIVLNVFGIRPNLRVVIWNLPFFFLIFIYLIAQYDFIEMN